jgi:hypothetical protein
MTVVPSTVVAVVTVTTAMRVPTKTGVTLAVVTVETAMTVTVATRVGDFWSQVPFLTRQEHDREKCWNLDTIFNAKHKIRKMFPLLCKTLKILH